MVTVLVNSVSAGQCSYTSVSARYFLTAFDQFSNRGCRTSGVYAIGSTVLTYREAAKASGLCGPCKRLAKKSSGMMARTVSRARVELHLMSLDLLVALATTIINFCSVNIWRQLTALQSTLSLPDAACWCTLPPALSLCHESSDSCFQAT